VAITTVLARCADLSYDEGVYGWRVFIHDADYDENQTSIIIDALMGAQQAAMSDLLPEGCTWQPSTSEIIGPVGSQIDTPGWLINESSRIVIDNIEEIIHETLEADPTREQ
jgi:hypothetical protein